GLRQDGLGLAVPGDEGQDVVVARQPDAAGGQLAGGLGGQPLAVEEEDGLRLGHKAVGHGIGGALDVHGTQVEQPGQVVQLAHHLGGAAQLGQFGPQAGQLFGGGGPGVGGGQQPGGGGGQGRPVLGPQLVLQVQGADGYPLGVQHLLQAAHQLAGGGQAAQAQLFPFLQGVGAVLLDGGHARL